MLLQRDRLGAEQANSTVMEKKATKPLMHPDSAGEPGTLLCGPVSSQQAETRSTTGETGKSQNDGCDNDEMVK